MPDAPFPVPGGTELRGYVSRPPSDGDGGPWPGVVVIQDLFGLSDDIRAQTDRIAAAGYVAFAPDLYSGRGVKCVLATLRASRSGEGRAFDEIAAARRWLVEQPDCEGPVGIIGFCMGGAFALLLAPSGDYDAASVNYGDVPKDARERLAGACPIVGSYGGRDISLRGRAARLESALTELGVEHDVKEYPGAGHGFLNHLQLPPGISQFVSWTGTGYHGPSAEDAWPRILAFFDTHLRGTTPGPSA